MREDSVAQSLEDPEAITRLVDRSVRPGTSVSFTVPEGRVNVARDGTGDWTIMVGLASRSEKTVQVSHSLERLGFFRAAENDGTVYFLWTSALHEGSQERQIVEELLFEILRTLQKDDSTHYIC